ncbi:hypothetical protein [Desulfatitalea alkaliphila]|uniref:Uncharacterized protein n=1 Tax=Desulfatitalea alkaliphila TaxID=2929485 RepID=A0AA41R786_9BACT|nr:hypothetical protein [Desulfatitalea alkaliphila]MCJ8502211.1 hypothetical protein [Desulfatitalea alkaliphila]
MRFNARGIACAPIPHFRLRITAGGTPMSIVVKSYHEKIAILRMANGATNPISLDLIDDLFPTDDIEHQAIEKIAGLLSHPSQAFAAIKASKVERIRARYEKHREASIQVFLDCWFSETGQTLLTEASRKF